MDRIVFSTAIDSFVIIKDEQTQPIPVKLDDNGKDDGYLVLNDEQYAITKKAFEGVYFILNHELQETELRFAIYEASNDSLNLQSSTDKTFDTGDTVTYAQGTDEDSDEIKALKMQSILVLRDFKYMCINIIGE